MVSLQPADAGRAGSLRHHLTPSEEGRLMAKKTTDNAHPWHQIEEQAFHAYREWPLWLVLRQRELQRQLHGTATTQNQPKRHAYRR